MPKTNLEWAMEAYVHCVEALEPLGSDNKRFKPVVPRQGEQPPVDLAAMELFILRKRAMQDNLKPNQPKTGSTITDVAAYGRLARAQKAGNCFEHAAVAATFMSEQQGQVPVFDIIQIPTLDHAFLIIGQPAPPNGVYPMQFANFAADAAICDGWARICCPARDYATIWDRTMNVWNAGGLEVPLGNQAWGSPNTYRGDVERYPKDSYKIAPAPSKWCFIATAACAAFGLDEDCEELNTLRRFRDEVLRPDPAWAAKVDEYYQITGRGRHGAKLTRLDANSAPRLQQPHHTRGCGHRHRKPTRCQTGFPGPAGGTQSPNRPPRLGWVQPIALLAGRREGW